MRRRGVILAAVVGVALALGTQTAPSIAGRIAHPRDTAAFRDYVTTYVGEGSSVGLPVPKRDHDWVAGHPDAVLALGDRACDWLSQRPSAPELDPSGEFQRGHLANRYVKQSDREEPLPLSLAGRSTVVAGAWTFLCWSEARDKTTRLPED